MNTIRVFLADLNHSAPQDRTFPYAVGCVASRCLHRFGDAVSVRIFKSLDDLARAFREESPQIVGFSNYIWNKSLSYELAWRMKREHPGTVTVMGGPNYPEDPGQQRDFLLRLPALDFYVYHEGELGFEGLVSTLAAGHFDLEGLRAARVPIDGCHYLAGGELVRGQALPKLRDLDSAFPSPYLSGLMDPFFGHPLSPLVQYTRGCPFQCTFCVEGLPFYGQVARQDLRRFSAEVEYIAQRVQGDPKLHIADANFGMYKEDVAVGEAIADVQRRYGWPNRIHASTGKNETERIVHVVDLLGGALRFGAALQSTNETVLRNIKRSNISTGRLVATAQQVTSGQKRSYSDLILNLPGDSVRAHQDSLRTVIDAGIMRPVMNQLLLLPGTEMDTPAERAKHGLVTRYRILPRSLGLYRFGAETFSTGEIVETVVASSSMSFEDYVECKLFDLSVELFYTDQYLVELTGWIGHLGLSVFDLIRTCHEVARNGSDELRALYESFRAAVVADLWESRPEVEAFVRDPNRLADYARNEYRNSLATNRAIAVFRQAGALHEVARHAALRYLQEQGRRDQAMEEYVDEALRFSLARKGDLLDRAARQHTLSYDFAALAARSFAADPLAHRLPEPRTFCFEPTADQLRLMDDVLGAYEEPVLGMRALLYRTEVSSLVDFFRGFRPLDATLSGGATGSPRGKAPAPRL